MTDTKFACRLLNARRSVSPTQEQLVDRSGAHVIENRRDGTGGDQPALGIFRSIALALNWSAASLPFDDDEHGPQGQVLRLKPKTVDPFTLDKQEHVAALNGGTLLRHHPRQAFSGLATSGTP